MPFDPNQPFTKPAFDPNSPFDREKPQKVKASGLNYLKAEEIDQEMHQDITTGDRLIVKNFGNDPQASVAYLQEQHPNLDIAHNGNQILVRDKGEKRAKVLDPDTGLFSSDIGYDLLDVVGDVAIGAGETAATIGGGIAGGLATLPTGGWGAIPAAIGAGASAGAGLEAARQGIGKMLGVNKELKGTDIAVSGVLGAATPALFGSGAVGKQAIKALSKYATKEGGEYVAKEGLKGAGKYFGKKITAAELARPENLAKLLTHAQRGIPKKIMAPVGSAASGVLESTLKNYSKHAVAAKKLADEGEEVLINHIEGINTTIQKTIAKQKSITGQALDNSIKGSNVTLNPKEIFEPILDLRDELVIDAERNPKQYKEQLSQVENFIKDNIGDFVDPKEKQMKIIMGLRKELASQAKLDPSLRGQLAQVDATISSLAQTKSKKVLQIPKEITAYDAWKLQDLLAQESGFKNIRPENILLSGMNPKAAAAKKRLAHAVGESYNNIKDEIDTIIPEAGEARAQYKKISRLHKSIIPYFGSTEATYNTLRTAGNAKKVIRLQKLRRFDKEFGTNLVEEAEKLDAYQFYADANLMPISGGNTTSTSRSIGLGAAGGTAGYVLADSTGKGGPVRRAIGAMLGVQAGQASGGPKAMQFYIDFAQKVNPLTQYLGRKNIQLPRSIPGIGGLNVPTVRQALPSVYTSLRKRGE